MKKSMVLVLVTSIVLVTSTLALIALYVMTQESRIAERKVRRLRAYYAAQAGRIFALNELFQGNTATHYWVNNIGDGYPGFPWGGLRAEVTVQSPDPQSISDSRVTIAVQY